MNCLGSERLLLGQRRVPDPPERMTGLILMMTPLQFHDRRFLEFAFSGLSLSWKQTTNSVRLFTCDQTLRNWYHISIDLKIYSV